MEEESVTAGSMMFEVWTHQGLFDFCHLHKHAPPHKHVKSGSLYHCDKIAGQRFIWGSQCQRSYSIYAPWSQFHGSLVRQHNQVGSVWQTKDAHRTASREEKGRGVVPRGKSPKGC